MFQTDIAPASWRSWFRRFASEKKKQKNCSPALDSRSSSVGMGLIPLDQAPPGRSFQIGKVKEGKGLCCKLYGMGVVPGVILTVISNAGRGPVVASVQGSRIGLGRGMAMHIWGVVCSE